MSKLIFLRGLPGSGKTTYAMELVRNADPLSLFVRVNKDDIRVKLGMSRKGYKREQEFAVVDHRDHLITEALKMGLNVVSDDTNFGKKHEPRLRQIAKDLGAEFEVKDFTDVPVDVCIARDALRVGDACVGESVIWGMAESGLGIKRPVQSILEAPRAILDGVLVDPLHLGRENGSNEQYISMGSYILTPYVSDPSLPDCIVCDLDGTLAIHNNRGPYDFQKCDTDTLNTPIWVILDTFEREWWEHAEGNNRIIYLSGRDDSVQRLTETWLRENGCPEGPLFMRKTGDTRKDCIIKAEIFDREIRGKYNVLFCLEDRDQMVKLYRDMGLCCLQCNYGAF